MLLEDLAPDREKRLGRYCSRQAETIRGIHGLLTAGLRRCAIEGLSRKDIISTAALKSVFKAAYGQPIGTCMREYRLRRAMELLEQGEGSVAEIAGAAGWESRGDFAEAFKGLAGTSPSAYRRQRSGAGGLRREGKM